ncbi:DUF2288 domain-containing protein [Pandoraea bronchicola]|uniref:DUF2288 domain-containing protein n=1 Tax=Pandoraea bronchicola TaxID=2508287 RepID=A0A5E5BLS8_9BURK|nr:DUF2288 domain-containing protein [Pandoraea bronchicola]VVE86789.1 hypothetical protein PBR20603_00711 [Pandoraea bronchicola]
MDSPKPAKSDQPLQNAASGASDVYLRLLSETAKIDWKDLESFFARGVLLYVAPGVDLVSVAEAVANDDKDTVSQWLSSGMVQRMQANHATDFAERTPELWAVVVAPWVLVQERGIVA